MLEKPIRKPYNSTTSRFMEPHWNNCLRVSAHLPIFLAGFNHLIRPALKCEKHFKTDKTYHYNVIKLTISHGNWVFNECLINRCFAVDVLVKVIRIIIRKENENAGDFVWSIELSFTQFSYQKLVYKVLKFEKLNYALVFHTSTSRRRNT